MTNLKPLTAALAVVALLAVSGLWLIDREPIPIYDNAGNSIESIFAGIAPSEHADWILAIDRDEPKPFHKHDKLKQGSTVVGFFDRAFGVETAHAQDDEIDCSWYLLDCAGHYRAADWRYCVYSCGGTYDWYRVKPQWADFEDGSEVLGDETECCGNICKETPCYNDFDDEEDYQDQ